MGVGEEREICFEEDGIITLKDGVVICIEGDKFKVVSSDRKEVVHFDKEGKVINKIPDVAESSRKRDLGCLKYFSKMGKKERKIVKCWLRKQKPQNDIEEIFLKFVKDSVNEVHYGFYIATVEASLDENGLYYKEGDSTCNSLSNEEWAMKAKKFAPEYKSDLASLGELYYWLAYKVANGELTLDDFDKISLQRVVLRGL